MIVLYVLDKCPYCNNSLKILTEKKIKHTSIVVKNTEKDFYKKQNNMNTFPQIFMKVEGDNYMKIGGNDDLIEIFENCDNIKNSNVSLDAIYYMYKNIYKK
jgi:glutaredoxin